MFNSITADRTDYAEPELRAVLAHFGHDLGQSAGGFGDALLTAMQRADSGNLLRLTGAFPEFGMPFYVAARMPRGVEIVAAALQLKRAHLSYRWVFIDAYDGRHAADILEQAADNLARL